ncbi:MAG: PAS domain-containing protein [Myxococcaceae bacterium]|nr:PAS domain-containing protein [Myxococcaceae bacterium]
MRVQPTQPGEPTEAASCAPSSAGPVSALEEQLESTRRLLHELSQVHAELLVRGDPRALLERLLALAVELTRSERGWLGELHRPPEGPPSLRLHAAHAWEDAQRELEPLVGTALASGEPVLIQAPGADTQEAPPGAAPRRAFLGLPFTLLGQVVGWVGLANRPGGYDEGLIASLQPLLTGCGSVLHVWREAERRRQDEQARSQAEASGSQLAGQRPREQQVAESTERLRLALESVDDAVWDWDVRTGVITASPRWLTMLGYEPMMKPTLAFWREQLCHPEDLPEAERRLAEHMEGRSPRYELEHRLRHKDGSWVWVLGRSKVVEWDEQGRPLRVVGTNVDITSRKRAEEQLQAFIQAIPDMLFRVRLDGTCLAFKESLLDPPAMRPEFFIGKNVFELPLPEHLLTHLRAALQRVTQDSSLEIFEYSLENTFGLQQYEARVVPSGPDEGLCIVRNITVRKALEEQRRRQQERLEERVREATRELEARQAQLIQSEKLASLGQMAASIAHELNNPVGYVSSNIATLDGYISLLRRLLELHLEAARLLGGEAPPHVAEVLERARALREEERLEEVLQDMDDLLADSREGTLRIREFIQDLKTFVREETGTPQAVDLNKMVPVTLRMLRHELKHKCQVRLDFGPLPLLRCLPTQINQVLMNLLMNASQAIELRGEIHISTRREGNEVLVRIRDTGRGMSPETQAKLFTPFFTTKPPGQGTGLGLSICYAIIARHKGRIEVESELGKGTTFIVRLPLTEE